MKDRFMEVSLVEGAGEDRVLFGFDMPEQDARYEVDRVATADISD
jgi:predicted TIM-barrel fold metal-dependent hydrolase